MSVQIHKIKIGEFNWNDFEGNISNVIQRLKGIHEKYPEAELVFVEACDEGGCGSYFKIQRPETDQERAEREANLERYEASKVQHRKELRRQQYEILKKEFEEGK